MISDTEWNELEPHLDVELRDLIYVMNQLPGIRTTECCSGHGIGSLHVWFDVAEDNREGLFYLARATDFRYFKHGRDWSIKVTVADAPTEPLPLPFLLERGVAPVEQIRAEVMALVENLHHHLNDKAFNLLYGLSRPSVRRLDRKKGWLVEGELIDRINDEDRRWGPDQDKSFRLRNAPLCSPQDGPYYLHIYEVTREDKIVQSYTDSGPIVSNVGCFVGTTGSINYLTGEVKGFRFQKPATPGNFVTASYWYRSAPAPHDKYAGRPAHEAAGWHPDDDARG